MFIDFFDIILFSGPFIVFGGMGQSKNSGKLTFKGLTSSDSTVSIVEDASSITFSSNSSASSPIDQYEIVYGTGTGITSSIFCVDIRSGYESITGVGVISPKLSLTKNDNLNVLPSACNNIIIGGASSSMTISKDFKGSSSMNNILIGGCTNCDLGATISNYGNYNSIVGGELNSICNSNSSVIISGYRNALRGSPISNSSIISSDNSQINGSTINSSIISSNYFVLGLTNSNSTIISSSIDPLSSPIVRSSYNSMMASSYNSSLGGCSNILLSVSNSDFATNSRHSSIFSSSASQVGNLYHSSIISGVNNYMVGRNQGTTFSRIHDSSIFAGCDNCLYSGINSNAQSLCSSAIFSGRGNNISAIWTPPGGKSSVAESFKGSAILGGSDNQILGRFIDSCISPINALVIGGGMKNRISCSFNNSIITNGEYNYISAGDSAILAASSSSIVTSSFSLKSNKFTSSRNIIISSNNSNIKPFTDYHVHPFIGFDRNIPLFNSAIVSNDQSYISRGYNNVILSGEKNSIRDIGSGPTTQNNNNVIIGGGSNYLSSVNSSILGGQKNCISQPTNNCLNSSILGGLNNTICGLSLEDNSIVGGRYNSILNMGGDSPVYRSVIVGGKSNTFGVSIGVNNSVIVGGDGLMNCWSNSAMINRICIGRNLYYRGITGFSGVWTTSAFTLCARGGIITIY